MNSEPRILVVDDDSNLLAGLRRQLRNSFDITTAQSGPEAITAIQAAAETHTPFAVVLSDMRMPGMDGIETLKQVQTLAPETVRMMLTGNADQQTAIDAINEGNIFRFFTKPCPHERLIEGLQAGIAQYRLVTAERDLLEKTLAGSIKVLVEVVSLNDPVAQVMSTRLREWVRILTAEFKLPHRWHLEVAAALVPISQIAIPPELVAKKRRGEPLKPVEQSMFERGPETARNLIANIPRLAKVAEIVYLQDRGYDGSGFPPDGPVGNDIPIDARILKILKDLAEAAGTEPLSAAAFVVLSEHRSRYDPNIFDKIKTCLRATIRLAPAKVIEVPLTALRVGQTVLSDVQLANGHLIVAANTRLSEPHIERLSNLAKIFMFKEPIKIRE